MYKIMMRLLAVFAMAALLPAAPAMAQATRTWVSGVGDDVNPCSRTAPCKTFAGAISKTAAGGEINTLDPGGFGAVTITKSITISSVGNEAGILVSGTNGITINAGVNDRVVLRGLDIDGFGSTTSGVRIVNAADVLIEDCVIHNFGGAGGTGIKVDNNNPVRLTVSRTTIQSNDTGINLIPAVTAGNYARAKVLDSYVLDSKTMGLNVDGTGSNIQLMNNRIIGKASINEANGGVIASFGNNLISGGATAPSATLPLQ